MRIGKFGFLNNYLPYYFVDGLEVVEASPRKMTEMLLSGRIDYAPVPTFFYLSRKKILRHYRFCVASEGEVLSVVVVSKEKRLDDKPIAVTADSMTSVNLLRIILREKGMRNELVEMRTARASDMLRNFSHALVIGDEAIKARMMYKVVMDLGEEWYELTELPMVFGISASLKSVDAAMADRIILESVRRAYENIDVIIREAEHRFSMPREFLKKYFQTLHFEFGSRERRGMIEFERMCVEHGLLREEFER